MEQGSPCSPPIFVVGLNYRAAAVEVRERLAFGREGVSPALHELTGDLPSAECPISGAVLLSTCNRTEIYIHFRDLDAALHRVQAFWMRHAQSSQESLQPAQYVFQGEAAALHLLRVAAGLDSMVVGENEILGQVRGAAELAQAAGTASPVLSALFRSAIQAGKRARAETTIGVHGLSVASLVVEMAGQIMGPLSERTALLIGAGKISSMTARLLAGAGLHWILVANRTYERAKELAAKLKGVAVRFDGLEQSLEKADIVICSTGAPHLVLHADMIHRAQATRGGRPLLVADLAVPRDVDPEIASIPGVRLVNIDGLEAVMKNSRLPLDSVCRQVENIALDEMRTFCEWCAARRCASVLAALNQKAEQIYLSEAERALRRLGPLTSRQQQVVHAMAKAIAGKILHDPVTRLRELAGEDDSSSYLHLAQDLYRLP
jgi:glutamyl-tRNA reductase